MAWYLLRVGAAGRRLRRDAGPADRPLPRVRGGGHHPPGAHRPEPGQRERVRDRHPGVRLAWLDRPLGSVALAIAMCVRPTLGWCSSGTPAAPTLVAVVWTVATGSLIVLLTLPIVGIDGYRDYVTVLRNLSEVTGRPTTWTSARPCCALGVVPCGASLALYGGYALGIGAMLFSLRYDRETSFMVTIGATLLLAPLLWDHYLATLLLPAAFLAQRGNGGAWLLPLLAWLPQARLCHCWPSQARSCRSWCARRGQRAPTRGARLRPAGPETPPAAEADP